MPIDFFQGSLSVEVIVWKCVPLLLITSQWRPCNRIVCRHANYPSEICPLSSVSFLSAVSAIDYLDLYWLIRHNGALSLASTEKICYHVINPQWCKQTPDSRHRHLSLHCHRGTPLASIKRRQELDRLSHDNVHTRTHMTPRMLLFSSVLW